MKGITLWQPWASLIAQGVKKIETRPRATPYRGPLLIHASKAWGKKQKDAARDLAEMQPRLFGELFDTRDMPFGVVVAIARLVDVRPITSEWIAQQTEVEIDVGNWTLGRFGWVLADVCPVKPGIPMSGVQAAPFTVRPGEHVAADAWARLQALDPLGGLRG
jgi:hypothetical protein